MSIDNTFKKYLNEDNMVNEFKVGNLVIFKADELFDFMIPLSKVIKNVSKKLKRVDSHDDALNLMKEFLNDLQRLYIRSTDELEKSALEGFITGVQSKVESLQRMQYKNNKIFSLDKQRSSDDAEYDSRGYHR